MSNEEFAKRIGKLYDCIISQRKDEDYVVNQSQMDKLLDILEFFSDMAAKSNGNVKSVILSPREEHSGVTVSFNIFSIYGNDIERFSRVIKHVSAMDIDTTPDNRLNISITVPNVFVAKQ